MSQPSTTNQLRHGAMLAALYMLLFMIVLYVPFFNMLAIFFLPLPIMIFVLGHGLAPSLVLGAVCIGLTLLLAPFSALFVTVAAVSVGLVMGFMYARKKGSFLPLLSGMVTYIANYVLLFLIAFFVLDQNIVHTLERFVQDTINTTGSAADLIPLPADEQAEEVYATMTENVSYLFPGLLMLFSLGMASIHHAVARPVLSRLGHAVQTLPPFREWNFPRSFLFYYLFALILILIGGLEEGSTLFMMVINLQFILEILLLIQGVTFVAHVAYVKKWGTILPVLAAVISLIPVFNALIRILGILDLGMGLKGRVKST